MVSLMERCYPSKKTRNGHSRKQVHLIRTWFGALPLIVLILLPSRPVATNEASNAFGVNILATDAEGCCFASSGTFLLLSQHEMDFSGFDILADMPGGETIFVLFFSEASGQLGRAVCVMEKDE